jgi:hypothetical protein
VDGALDALRGFAFAQRFEQLRRRQDRRARVRQPLPAMSGALPCTGSTSVKLSLALALGASPSPPTSAAAASLRMSP